MCKLGIDLSGNPFPMILKPQKSVTKSVSNIIRVTRALWSWGLVIIAIFHALPGDSDPRTERKGSRPGVGDARNGIPGDVYQ